MPNCMLVCTVLLLDAILMELVIGKTHIHTHSLYSHYYFENVQKHIMAVLFGDLVIDPTKV